MGRAFIFVIFFACFVVFAIIKLAFTGVAAAFEAVFDPNAKDEKIKALINDCMIKVSHVMHQKYTKQPGELKMAILQLTPAVQSMILEAGYKAPATVAAGIVCQAIVGGGHATEEEVKSTLA